MSDLVLKFDFSLVFVYLLTEKNITFELIRETAIKNRENQVEKFVSIQGNSM